MRYHRAMPSGAEIPGLIDRMRKLWILDLVVKHGGFQQAALRAKVTRSAISQSVSQLERFHGKNLLVRERGAVRATPYCQALLDRARPVIEALLELDTGPTPVPRMSWLDLGAFESLAIAIVPRLLKTLERSCPGIRVTVKVGRSDKLATMVRKGELCMAIVSETEGQGGLTVIPVAEDRLGLYLSAPLAADRRGRKVADTISVGALSAGSDGQPRYVTRFTRALDLTRRITFWSDSLEALLAAACHGSIAAVLPESVARRGGASLVEITPPEVKGRGIGRHAIFLISQKNCDPAENDFLAAEIKRLLGPAPR